MSEQQPFNRADVERRYTEWRHIIEVGAYSESPPEDYDEEWEPDGSLWYGDVNIDEALATLEARADAEDLKFVSTTPYKPNTAMVYVLVPLSEQEKRERAERIDALRQASLVAQLRWQDQSKLVLSHDSYVLGKLPADTSMYVVEILAEVREDDPIMSYSWPESQHLVVSWQDGKPIVDVATDEQIEQAKEGSA